MVSLQLLGGISLKNVFKFIRTTMIFGLASILPLVLIIYVVYWLFNLILDNVHPIARLVSDNTEINIILASLITVSVMLAACFLLGLIVRTRIGKFFHEQVEKRILKKIPGYTVTKEVVLTFSGEQEAPFSSAVMCRPFGGNVWMTGFVTDRCRENGTITVFVPTGPNPTSGNIYHLPEVEVRELDKRVEEGIKTVIGCGAGSTKLIKEAKISFKPEHARGV